MVSVFHSARVQQLSGTISWHLVRGRNDMAKRESSLQDSASGNNQGVNLARTEASSELLRELVAHLRQNRTQLREEWVSTSRRMGESHC